MKYEIIVFAFIITINKQNNLYYNLKILYQLNRFNFAKYKEFKKIKKGKYYY